MNQKKIEKILTAPRIVLPITALFYLVGLTGHLYKPTLPLMLTLTPWVILIFGAWAFSVALTASEKKLILWAGITYFVTFVLEAAGVATGSVFGHYHYGSTLGLMAFQVPLVIGFNWTIIILSLSEMSGRLKINVFFSAFLTALGAVLFDVVLEPVAMALDYWQWRGDAVPLQNYLAWFVIAFAFSFLYRKMEIRTNTVVPAGYIGIQWLFFLGLLIGLKV
jgi:putative membrane protein